LQKAGLFHTGLGIIPLYSLLKGVIITKAFFRFLLNLLLVLAIALGGYSYLQAHPQLLQQVFPATQAPVQKQKAIPVKGDPRWRQNTATVAIDLANPRLRQAAYNGIAAWNRTGTFNFKTTNDVKNAQITIGASSDPASNKAGLTESKYDPLTKRMLHAKVTLNSYYLLSDFYNYDEQRLANTVEHELGHAIGLKHTNEVSVMYPKGSLYTIQPRDVQAVKALYNSSEKSRQ
jgi:predicted Zn-dependent protease